MANAVPEQRQAQVFLTNQTAAVYKQLANLATQQTPSKDIKELTMSEIVNFMKEQFDPELFIVRERFKFWSDMQRKPGKTLQELAARIRQDAATYDFPSIKDPQDKALRQRFICFVNNEAALKALFKIKDTELTFARAVQVAIETRRGKGCQGNCLQFQGQAGQQGSPEQEEGSAAERLVQTFKQARRKSSLPPKRALQDAVSENSNILWFLSE